jgi:hypothetical protein
VFGIVSPDSHLNTSFGQMSVKPGKFGWKTSGFENLVSGGATEQERTYQEHYVVK